MSNTLGPEVFKKERDGSIRLIPLTAFAAGIPNYEGKVIALYLRAQSGSGEFQFGLTAEQAIAIGENLANLGRDLQDHA